MNILTSLKRYAVLVIIASGFLAAACSHAETLGIEGGYFTCNVPQDWKFTDNDPDYGDERTYMVGFVGPSAEGASALIYISYFGDGNDDFNDYVDFVNRNTTDILGEVLAVAEKTDVNGKDALTFGYEKKQYLNPHSKDDTWVMIREKFYVLLAKDRKGFFVLEYSAPSSGYEEYLPVFQGIVDSFEIV